jgi:hypothetical protein
MEVFVGFAGAVESVAEGGVVGCEDGGGRSEYVRQGKVGRY